MVTLQFLQYRNAMRKFVLLVLPVILMTSCGYRAQVFAEETEVLFHEGMKWFYLGDVAAAEGYFKRVVARDKNNDAAFYHLSQIAAYNNQWELAEKHLQKALRLQPDNYWYRLEQAKMLVAAGSYEKAQLLYESLWKDYPTKTELLYERIGLFMNNHQNSRSLDLLDTLEERSGVTESSILLRFNLMAEDNKEQAETMLRDWSREEPSPRVLSILGDIEASEGRIDSAGVYYNRTLEMDPSFMPAVFGLAETYRMKRQFDLFFENINVFLAYPDIEPRMKTDYLEQIIESRGFVATFQPQVDTLFLSTRSAHPTDSTLAQMYAAYLIRTQRPEQAIEVVKENTNQYPEDYHVWYHTLTVIYYLKEWPLLCEYAARSLEAFPDNVDFSSLYGLALWQTGQTDMAVERFERILGLLKKDDTNNRVQTLSLLGDLYHEIGDSRQAYKMYEQVLQLDKENLPVLNNFAYYLSLEERDLERALAMSKVTVDTEPNNATYLDTYGWILHKLGRTAEAKTIFRQALAYGGKESAVILVHYGDVLHALNEPLMAVVYWQQAYDLEPSEDLLQKINANKKIGQ
jgi:tetratricopeptide (TPR) repeat protein